MSLLAGVLAGCGNLQARSVGASLIERFGTIRRALTAVRSAETEIEAITTPFASRFFAVARLVEAALRREAFEGPVLSTAASVIDMLHYEMGDLPHETLRILYLDSTNRLIADESFGHGSVANVCAAPRDILHHALRLEATALIIVHNHPSGDPKPSNVDREVTGRIIEACRTVGVAVHDHLIIGRETAFSFAAQSMVCGSAPADRPVARDATCRS